MSIGAHIHAADVLAAAVERKAEVVQFFLGDPQSWKTPNPHAQAEALTAAGIDIYIHSPYPVNIAATNNRIRIPSRKTVLENAAAAAKSGAKGLIVHGGHVTAKEDPGLGLVNWRKFFERQSEAGGFPLPILIENTAGGNAMARGFDMKVPPAWRLFFYMPLHHSERLADQQRATALVASLPDRGDPERGENRRYGLPYVDVIDRFGRFPHRNAILGRQSTPEELAFLAKRKPQS